VSEEFARAIPPKFQARIKNVGFLVEDEPSPSLRAAQGLRNTETLLGLYRGVPAIARGNAYGVGATLPDSIVLYRIPIEAVAAHESRSIREVIRETIWHEVAHYFGLNEREVRRREKTRKES